MKEVSGMLYYAKIKINRKELMEKLDKLESLTREIRNVTLELDSLGVVELTDDGEEKEEAASGN